MNAKEFSKYLAKTIKQIKTAAPVAPVKTEQELSVAMIERAKRFAATQLPIKILYHGQQIRTNMDGQFRPVITVGTMEGYAAQYNETAEKAMAQQIRCLEANPHNGLCFAWANKSASCLTSDYKGKALALELAAAAYGQAVLVEDGEVVLIEGRIFTVKYMGINYSDPVKFIPVI